MTPDVSISGRAPLVNAGSNYSPTKREVNNLESNRLITSENQVVRLEKQGKQFSLGEEQLIKAIDRAIKALEGPNTAFEVSVHEKTNSIMVKVLNKDTGELIREIPPEKTLDLVAKMMEIAGILIDERI